MAEPKLRTRASGFGGSGYYNPLTGQKVIGVTTALGVLDKPGVNQWAVDQTAAYAVNNIDALLSRTQEAGFGFLRWYWSRLTPKKFDDPEIDIRNVASGVLNDLADLGTSMHEWVEQVLTGGFEPELVRDEQVQMAEAFLAWLDTVEIETHATELTVFGANYGGTADLYATVNGVPLMVDIKTSRAVRHEHIAQIAAYGAAFQGVAECGPGAEGAVEYKGRHFREVGIPAFSGYAVLQIRPDDWDNDGNFVPAFCKLHHIPQESVDAGYELFQAAVDARHAQKVLKDSLKGVLDG